MKWWVKGLIFTLVWPVVLVGGSMAILSLVSRSMDPFAVGRLATSLGSACFFIGLLGLVTAWMWFYQRR